jgi:hypothetical protein
MTDHAVDHAAAERFAKWYISRSDTDDDGDNLSRAYLALTRQPSEGVGEPWCWLVRSGATLRASLGAAFTLSEADRLLALADTEDARRTLGTSHLVPLYAAASPVAVTEAMCRTALIKAENRFRRDAGLSYGALLAEEMTAALRGTV